MCGRFVNLTKINKLKKQFDIKNSTLKDIVSYNIAPSQISCVIIKKKEMILDAAKWGYSFYDKKVNQQKNIINSRIETIKNKILFKESYFNRKCLIPINGYYEWTIKENKKIPIFIHIPPCEPMYLAGIWKYIDFNQSSKKIFSVITKNANNKLVKIHHRMPIILSTLEGENYLNDHGCSFLDDYYSSNLETDLDFYRVSNFVNNPLNNSKECIKIVKN